MRYAARVVLMGGLLAAAACGGDSTTGPGPSGSISATIDGGHWTSSLGSTASHLNGFYSIGGSNSTYTIGVAFPDTLGTSAIGPISPTNVLLIKQGGATWVANVTGGSGTVSLTSATATEVKGTFSFTLIPQSGSGASGNLTITNGTFDVTF